MKLIAEFLVLQLGLLMAMFLVYAVLDRRSVRRAGRHDARPALRLIERCGALSGY